MKKKRYLIFLVMFSLFFVVGQQCDRSGDSEGSLGGKDGLIVDFVEDAPPLSGIFQNVPFPIDVELINKGEADVGQGAAIVYLTGVLASDGVVQTEMDQASNDAELFAVEESEGERVEDSLVVEMGEVTYVENILVDSVPLNARVSVCYPYETRVQVDDFCVPSTARTSLGEDDCEIIGTENVAKEEDNSGAPVHVTSLREQAGPDFVRVTLDINNVGTGDVVQPGLCARELSREQLNKVKVTMPQNFECTFREGESHQGVVELRSGHAVLRCKRDVQNSGSAFKESIGIKLNYNYLQEASRSVTVNREV